MIQTSCPQCLTGYKLPDSQAGKKVRCKSCEATFVVEPPAEDVPVLEEAEPEDLRRSRPTRRADVDDLPVLEDGSRERTRPGPPPRSRSRDEFDDDERPVRRRRTPDDDEDDRPRSAGGPGAGLIIGIVAALVLVIGGGGGLAWYLLTQGDGDLGGATKPPDNPIPPPPGGAMIGNPGGGMMGIPGGPIGNPGGPIGNPGGPIGNPGGPIGAPKDDKGKDGGISIPDPVRQPPKNVTEALDAIRSGESARVSQGLSFLRNNSKEQERRDEVGRALSPLLRDPKTAAEAAAAAANWPSKEILGDLIDLADSESQVPYLNAVHALGKYDDEKAFAALAKLLVPLFKSGPAADALRVVGKKAEKHVVPYLHHKERRTQQVAQQLLEGYGTEETLLLEQTLKDLTSTEAQTKQSAAKWLATKKPSPERKEQHELASKALEAMLKDESGFARNAALDALVNWATPDNIQAIGEAAVGDFTINRKKVVAILSKLKDEKAAIALAVIYVKYPGERREVGKVLLAMGPLAEKAGWVMINQDNLSLRREGVLLLGDVGTAETIKGLTKIRPALMARDKTAGALVTNAIAKIKSRMK